MFSEVCTPLTTRCLRAPLLYSVGLVVLCDHINHDCGVAAIVYRREQCPWRFGRKLDSEDSGEWSRIGLPRGTSETHLCMGRPKAIQGVTRPGTWPFVRASCQGALMRTKGSLLAS